MKKIILIFILQSLCFPQARAAEAKPVYKWVPANELYFTLPIQQDVYFPGSKDTAQAHPWGFGYRVAGNGEKISKTAAFQVQSVKFTGGSLPAANTIYIWDLLVGLEYMSPQRENKPLRFTASAVGALGLADTDLFIAPVVSAGLLYVPDQTASTPNGFTFNVFYRLTEIKLSDVGSGVSATLRPAAGIKIGYMFEGFWKAK